MKYIILCLSLPFIISMGTTSINNRSEREKIQWMSWEEAITANEKIRKKFLVDIYTDWCSLCKVMDRETFADSAISAYVNKHFYAVKLNAEQRETIAWNGQEFKWVESGLNGVHELAHALCDGEMTFPTLVFLTEFHERIRISKGFKDARAFHAELVFAAEEHYLKGSNKP